MDYKIYAFICTRNKNLKDTTQKLVTYLSRCKVHIKLIVGSNSIFEGYKKTFELVKPNPSDVIILCHDDIQILSDPELFNDLFLHELVLNKETGFVGVAGTTRLEKSAVWWDLTLWQQQHHSGFVLHGQSPGEGDPSFYGKYRRVVVLDGLFLAARASTIEKVGLEKPPYFEGEWDFYDIHYTTTAHHLGFKNYTVPIKMIHYSSGELVGRDSWHKNRNAFINNTKLPIRI